MKPRDSLLEYDATSFENTLSLNKAKWHKTCYLKFNNQELKRAEKRSLGFAIKTNEDSEEVQKKLTRHSLPCKVSMKDSISFFCETSPLDEKIERRESATKKINERVKECATKLQDTALLAKLSVGDLVALEAKYHARCLVALYNKAERLENTQQKPELSRNEHVCHARALADIVSYIEDSYCDQTIAPVFQMPELTQMYHDRLKQMGIDSVSTIHSTRLKNKFLESIPDLHATKEDCVNILAFNDDIGPALKKACENNDLDLSKFTKWPNLSERIFSTCEQNFLDRFRLAAKKPQSLNRF